MECWKKKSIYFTDKGMITFLSIHPLSKISQWLQAEELQYSVQSAHMCQQSPILTSWSLCSVVTFACSFLTVDCTVLNSLLYLMLVWTHCLPVSGSATTLFCAMAMRRSFIGPPMGRCHCVTYSVLSCRGSNSCNHSTFYHEEL